MWLPSGIIRLLFLILITVESLTTLKTILKAIIVRAFSVSCLFILATSQSGCQSMQFGASPIPVIAHNVQH